MADYAIVIGIDEYGNPTWNLDGAVDDAIRFLRWVVNEGGVSAGNVQLFLSPVPAGGFLEDPALPEPIPVRPAVAKEITTLLAVDLDGTPEAPGWGADGDRLWVYFAGHGCSHPGARGEKRAEPILFPADMKHLKVDYKLPFGFSEILQPLRRAGPKEQFFFLDACRDFVLQGVAYANVAGMDRYLRPEQEGQARAQYMIYATGSGYAAVESQGQGVFNRDLLACLGPGPEGKRREAGARRYLLGFGDLHDFLNRTARRRLAQAGAGAERAIQIPEWDPEPRKSVPVLKSWEEKQIEPSRLVVRVEPRAARPHTNVSVYYEEYLLDAPPNEPKGPPVGASLAFELRPSHYAVQVMAKGYGTQRRLVNFPEDRLLDVTLEPESGATEPAANDQAAAPVPRTLSFSSRDSHAVLVVWDPGRNPHYGQGRYSFNDPSPGVYGVQLLSPEGGGEMQHYDFPACGPQVTVLPPPIALGQVQRDSLQRLGINTNQGYMFPSESMGEQANLTIGSLLAFAAYSVVSAPLDKMHRLRQIGMPAPAPDRLGEAWLTVVVTTKGDGPGDGGPVAFAADCRAVVLPFGRGEAWAGRLKPLEAFPAAAVAQVACAPGGISVELALPGVPNFWHAAVALPGRSTVLVFTVDDEGTVESQCYSFEFLDLPRQGPGVANGPEIDPERLRVAEQAQRFYAGRETLREGVRERLLENLLVWKMREPVVGCLAGYLLLRLGRGGEYRGEPAPEHPGYWYYSSPMQNMLHFYPELPDVHVLAALADPENADEHFSRALTLGMPLYTEGFQALQAWLQRTGRQAPLSFTRTAYCLNPGTAFSTWQGWQPAFALRKGRLAETTSGWLSLDEKREEIERRAALVGLLRSSGGAAVALAGTGFLVAPDLVLTAKHVVYPLLKEGPGALRFLAGARLEFTLADSPNSTGAKAISVAEVVAVSEQARMALLRLAEPAGTIFPLSFSTPPAVPGQTVYVIGYPSDDFRLSAERRRQIYGTELGTKHVIPGVVLAAPTAEFGFDYDSSTSGGTAGSPVFDLQSGAVLGLHFAGFQEIGYKRARAMAFWKGPGRDFLQLAGLI